MRRLLFTLLATALLAPAYVLTAPAAAPAAAAAAGVAAAGPVHEVNAGAVDPTDPLSILLYEAYFPNHLRVHRKDQVRWQFPDQGGGAAAFHTVTFGDPDKVPYARADELPGALVFTEGAFFHTGCGRPGLPVCVITSATKTVSSGTPIQHNANGKVHPFDAVIDLPPGKYKYFCTLHHPSMQGTIEVVPDHVKIKNPKPAEFTSEIRANTLKAKQAYAAASRPVVATEGARRVWRVASGLSAGNGIRVSNEAFLPTSLEIRAGDSVRWTMGGTAHTVTFPDTRVGLPLHISLNCEFDALAGGLAGVPLVATPGVLAGSAGAPPCPPGGTLEMAFSELGANQHRANGDAVVSPATLHNSGIMITRSLPDRLRGRPFGSGKFFPSEFEATFPVPGTYPYRCLIHAGFMAGSITVK